MFKRLRCVSQIVGIYVACSSSAWAQIEDFTDSGILLSLPGEVTVDIEIGDMNNDGNSDVVVVQQSTAASTIRVWLNDGEGGLVLGSELEDFSGGIELADFDQDGDLSVKCKEPIYVITN